MQTFIPGGTGVEEGWLMDLRSGPYICSAHQSISVINWPKKSFNLIVFYLLSH